MEPEISVIIPALNEGNYIRHALKGLKEQTFRNFETIVVDGGSKDQTRAIASKSASVMIERRKGPAIARNAGAKKARGKILLFLDADTKPSRNLLEIYSKVFKNQNVVAATGPIRPLEKAGSLVSSGYSFVSVFFVQGSIMIGRPSVVGANFAVRKDAFEKVKGFNPEMITYEDWDLSIRLRKYGRISFLNNAVVYTSIRRIKEWGISGFFNYYVGNIARYTLFKRPKKDYSPVR